MKTVCLIFATLCLILSSPAHALDIDNSCDGEFGTYVNSCSDRDSAVGAGLDFYLYKSDSFDIEQQSKYDLNNSDSEGFSTYSVVKVKTDEGVLQKPIELVVSKVKGVLGFVTGIFGEEE
jgi:hypothetical protein